MSLDALAMPYAVGRAVVVVGPLTRTPGIIVRVGRERGTVRLAGHDMEFCLDSGRVICKAGLWVVEKDGGE